MPTYLPLYVYVYQNHLASPFITREMSDSYQKIVRRINEISEELDKLDQEDPEFIFSDEYEDLYNKKDILLFSENMPIKCRTYFIGEISHTTIDKWSSRLERIIEDYLEKGTRNPLDTGIDFHIQDDIVNIITNKIKLYYSSFDNIQENISLFAKNKDIQTTETKESTAIKSNTTNTQNNNISSPKKRTKSKRFNPTKLYNKSINELSLKYNLHPMTLLQMLQRRHGFKFIGMEDRHGHIKTTAFNHKMKPSEISLCERTFFLLHYSLQKSNKKD